ncbi:P-loop NTPase family protein [Thermodesulfatator atlanticus]|uniref:hypothetical protein n=1 Tax=Thermodesulfatator atlanticus TaxID=501497 RepID=UPI0003B7A5A8|nr:hypothetical protein [Thermodesulfatator atlanticus]
MIPVVAFIGCEDRDDVFRAVTAELRRRGYKVGHIKEVSLAKNTQEPLEVAAVAELAFGRLYLKQDFENEEFEHLLMRIFEGFDIVLADGFAHVERIPKMEILKKGIFEKSLKGKVSGVLASISDYEVKNGKNFSLENIGEIVDFMEEHIIKPTLQINAVLFVNGRRVPLKKYVRETLAGVIEGFVSRLKMTENARDISVKIRLS